MNEAYANYVNRAKAKHPDIFSDCGLAIKFREYFGQKIRVRFSCGMVKTGWVSGTTGWRPSLMLMLRRHSSGSSWLLGDNDELLTVLDRGPR